ncbi:MAG: thiamine pyrophosphate-dependent enzyme [Dehalococcoidia bacterium]|nr:thiamine pyrophosphate-dependent enzyme [Dehalococcoidia bacterium]
MVQIADYAGGQPAWCPGCGNFGILNALKRALVELALEPHKVLMVSGIGQAGKLPHYTKGNVLNVLHGRTLPAASGAKIANPGLTVIAIGGDGDGYGEGGNHFIHSVRRNHDITYLVHNNQVYALTKGQTSPTSDAGFITKTTPHGAPAPLNALAVAIAAGGTFVARGFAGDQDHLTALIKSGIRHRGFALIDILQPCVSFNHRNTFAWYKERVYRLEGTGHDPRDRTAAMAKAQEWGERIPIGIIYQQERPVFEDQLPVLARGALVRQLMEPAKMAALLNEFM